MWNKFGMEKEKHWEAHEATKHLISRVFDDKAHRYDDKSHDHLLVSEEYLQNYFSNFIHDLVHKAPHIESHYKRKVLSEIVALCNRILASDVHLQYHENAESLRSISQHYHDKLSKVTEQIRRSPVEAKDLVHDMLDNIKKSKDNKEKLNSAPRQEVFIELAWLIGTDYSVEDLDTMCDTYWIAFLIDHVNWRNRQGVNNLSGEMKMALDTDPNFKRTRSALTRLSESIVSFNEAKVFNRTKGDLRKMNDVGADINNFHIQKKQFRDYYKALLNWERSANKLKEIKVFIDRFQNLCTRLLQSLTKDNDFAQYCEISIVRQYVTQVNEEWIKSFQVAA